jgi:hypothetical protein
MESPASVAGILSKIFQWLATHWIAILKVIAVGAGVAVAGITIWRYFEVTGRPEVQQITAQAVALTQAMIPIMTMAMMMHLMMTLISMFREMIPRKE